MHREAERFTWGHTAPEGSSPSQGLGLWPTGWHQAPRGYNHDEGYPSLRDQSPWPSEVTGPCLSFPPVRRAHVGRWTLLGGKGCGAQILSRVGPGDLQLDLRLLEIELEATQG